MINRPTSGSSRDRIRKKEKIEQALFTSNIWGICISHCLINRHGLIHLLFPVNPTNMVTQCALLPAHSRPMFCPVVRACRQDKRSPCCVGRLCCHRNCTLTGDHFLEVLACPILPD